MEESIKVVGGGIEEMVDDMYEPSIEKDNNCIHINEGLIP